MKLVLIYSELTETNTWIKLKSQIEIIEYMQKKDNKNVVYQKLWKYTLLKVML